MLCQHKSLGHRWRMLAIGKISGLLLTIAAVLIVDMAVMRAQAQSQRETPAEILRRRQIESDAQHNPYWDGFALKHAGNCTEAIDKLRPLARRGFGFENAQTALGECHLMLAGLDLENNITPHRNDIINKAGFQTGLTWITKAANAGHFEAQGILIELYAVNLAANTDKIEAAKWAHLYLTNPHRLNLGAPAQANAAITMLKENMNRDSWLIGKERARIWVPSYGIAYDKQKP